MKFEYTGRHIDVTPALQSHVEQHFERIGHLFNGNATKAHVIIEVERGRHRSEIIVNWRNEVLTAATSVADMYQSLSQTIDKIEKQALRIKNKVIDKSHRAEKAAVITAEDGAVTPAPSRRRIINERRYAVKPVTADEAALMLDEIENDFLVFRNSETNRIAVIYRRKDKNFGLIEPS
ncbi:MAG TPA: ribosome-associated translation inhibitor RaiA [Pyrinomonadaceae bacterium]|nr:ribosome-associated translation inhibitor RaiA [Pyrinomonadaceae bacterium]